MKRRPKWISLRAVLAIHERLLAEHGGASGIRDRGLLDSALDSVRNHFAHGKTDIFHLAAVHAHALTQNHPFVDGNKRVAFTVAVTFLERNGFRLVAPEPEAVQVVLALSSQKLRVPALAEWLRESSDRLGQPKVKPRARPARPPKRR